ncbi:MAG: M6 family metalloprotease domain-containing protein [Bacteroidales bacterium]
MRARTVFILLTVTVLALVASVVVAPPVAAPAGGRGFSAVPLRHAALDALRAHGKALRVPFPNSVNKGRKFVPGGELVPALATDATQPVIVLFVKFADDPPGGPATRLDLGTYFDSMLFGDTYDPPEYAEFADYPTDRTLFNYYRAVSYGKVSVVTYDKPSELGWVQLANTYEYYCQGDNGFGAYPHNAPRLVEDAIAAVDAAVDFSKYAINGVVPNLFVVHAGTGAEWNGDPNIIWSHSWSLSSGTPLTKGYKTDDGVVIDNYAMMPEVGGDLTGWTGSIYGPFPPTVGVYAHEYGHVLGLPDQYDYGYESEGTGIYSLMAGGSWNQWPGDWIFSGNSPSFLDAWSRYRLGFVTPTVIDSLTNVTLPPAEEQPTVFKMVVPFSGGKEYFLLENRQQIGFDQGLNVYGVPSGETVRGLAIYHIDDVVLSRNYWRPNEAENWKEFRSEGAARAWTGERHYGISLIQADDRWDLEHGNYGWFRSDLYPGSYGVTAFGSFTLPNSSSYYFWAGNAPKFGYSGVTVENITENAGTVKATLRFVK